jgi:acyl CoA:acetate/3-ketoacid CoA transferase alpha subunit
MGVPFMPARTALGSDLFKTNTSLKTMTCPFSGDILTAVSAIIPDVAIVHLQRADKFGNAHAWGNLGLTRDACLASRHIIITAEEIVEPEATPRRCRVITTGTIKPLSTTEIRVKLQTTLQNGKIVGWIMSTTRRTMQNCWEINE